jgi:hypothetical protein
MKKLLVVLGIFLGISFSAYSQCPTNVWTSINCGGNVQFTFNPTFFSGWNVVSYNADFGDGTLAMDSITLDSAEWVVFYTYTSNGNYNTNFNIVYFDSLTPGVTCSTTVSINVTITTAGPPPSSCSVSFTSSQICNDSIAFTPDFGSLTCGYYYQLGNTITNFGDTLPISCRLPVGYVPWPSGVTIYYDLMQSGNPTPVLQCSTSIAVPTVINVQLNIFADTMSLPTVIVHDTSSVNMYFDNIDWGDGNTINSVGDYSAYHTYILDGIYLINASALPSSMWIWWNLDSLSCHSYDTGYVEIRGESNSSSCNLNPMVNYIGSTQELDFDLRLGSQIVSSTDLDVQWSFSNGMNSNLDFGSFSGVSTSPTTYTVDYQIYDFWGNQVCTNSITNSVNSIYPPCQALTYIYEDTVTPGVYWAQDLSSGGLAPYTYLWDFGDGTTSSLQFPIHIYATPGYYTVCLTMTDSQVPPCVSTICVDSVGTILVDDNLSTRTSSPMLQLNVYNPGSIGIDEVSAESVNLFPNPAQNSIYLTLKNVFKENLRISIVDVTGQETKLVPHIKNDLIEVNLDSLPPGIYFVKLYDGIKSVTKKFIRN